MSEKKAVASRTSSVSSKGDAASTTSSRVSRGSSYSSEASVDRHIRQYPKLFQGGHFDLPKRNPALPNNQYILAVIETDRWKPRLQDKCQFYRPSTAPEMYQHDPMVSLNVGYQLVASKRQTQLASSVVISKAKSLNIQNDCLALFYISAHMGMQGRIDSFDTSDMHLESYQIMVRIDKSTSGSTRCYTEGLGTSFRYHRLALAHIMAQHKNVASQYHAIPSESTEDYSAMPLDYQLKLAFKTTSVKSLGRMPTRSGDWTYLSVVGAGNYEAVITVDGSHHCRRLKEFRPYGNTLFQMCAMAAVGKGESGEAIERIQRMINRIPTKVDSRRGSRASSTTSSRRNSKSSS